MNMQRVLPVILLLFITACQKGSYKDFHGLIQGFYNNGQYEECSRQSRSYLIETRARMMKKGMHAEIVEMYTLCSDCYTKIGDFEGAADSLSEMLAALDGKLSPDKTAETELKIGHIYRAAGRYTKAIAAYEHVSRTYANQFPDRFAKYAEESAMTLRIKRVAEITGRVKLPKKQNDQNVLIRIFNGFEESEALTDADGAFRVPLFSSTPGTKFIISASTAGFYPFLTGMTFDGRAELSLGTVKLKVLPEKAGGVLAGMVFTPVSGGKKTPRHGIARFMNKDMVLDRLVDLEEDGSGKRLQTYPIKSDAGGLFMTFLPAGQYRMHITPQPMNFALTEQNVRLVYIKSAQILAD